MSSVVNNMRNHTRLAFQFPAEKRGDVSKWLKEVQAFFHPTKVNNYFDRNKIESTVSSSLSRTMSSISATGPYHVSLDYDLSQLGNVLEGASINYIVQLISNLGHYSETYRMQAVYHLLQFSSLISSSPIVREHAEGVAIKFQVDDKGFHKAIKSLFQVIGKSFSSFAIAIAAGLECFYNCPDASIRGTCVSALSNLIYENPSVFRDQDQLTAVWNLFFLLSSYPENSKYYYDRYIVIESLGLLAKVYATYDLIYTARIVESLLKLKNKTNIEIETVKDSLGAIFKALEGNVENGIYSSFINLLNPHDENAYDLLAWAVKEYALSSKTHAQLQASPTSNQSKNSKGPSQMVDFVLALTNHFTASPALVRYGAFICFHTAVLLNPEFIKSNPSLYSHVVGGSLDSDYLTASLCKSILDELKLDQSKPEIIPKAVSANKKDQNSSKISSYDRRFCPSLSIQAGGYQVPSSTEAMKKAVAMAPEVPENYLRKISHGFEYMSKRQKLASLLCISLWCSKLTTYDSLLMQSVLPLCKVYDYEIQRATLAVIRSMQQALTTSTTDDVALIWTHLNAVFSGNNNNPKILLDVLITIKSIPIDKLSDSNRRDLLMTLFRLTFHDVPEIRSTTYILLGESKVFWVANNMLTDAIAVLLLSLGDQNQKCRIKCVNSLLSSIKDTAFKDISNDLELLRQNFEKEKDFEILQRFDDIALKISSNRSDFEPLIQAIMKPTMGHRFSPYVEEEWSYFMVDGVDTQLSNPDTYPFTRIFVHAPFWISILFTKLNILPPSSESEFQLSSNASSNRISPSERRRLQWGFLPVLIPLFGIPDPTLRKCACFSVVRCCFAGKTVQSTLTKGIIDLISQFLMNHKQWPFQTSTFDVLRLFLKLKIPGLSQNIVLQFLEHSRNVVYDTQSSTVKVAALEFLEAAVLVFPNGTSTKWQDIRDTVRTLMLDQDHDVSQIACRLFSILFACCPANLADIAFQYLKTDLFAMLQNHDGKVTDPTDVKLSIEESERILREILFALGANPHKRFSTSVMSLLEDFIQHQNPKFRAAAVSSYLTQIKYLEDEKADSILWTSLPLYADIDHNVRYVFHRFINGIPSYFELAIKNLPSHPQDDSTLHYSNLDDVLKDTDATDIASINLITDQLVDNDRITFDVTHDWEENLFLPTITIKLQNKVKDFVQKNMKKLKDEKAAETIFRFQNLQQIDLFKGSALLSLAEFGKIHFDPFGNEVIDILLQKVGQEITPDNQREIEAGLLGLRSIAEISPTAVKAILARLFALQNVNEGDLLALIYMSDIIKDYLPPKAAEFNKKITNMINNARLTVNRRLYSIYAAVNLSVLIGNDEMMTVLDAANIFLESNDDNDLALKVYASLSNIFQSIGSKHPIFYNLVSKMRNDVKSHSKTTRKRSLSVFKILSQFLSKDDAVWFSFLFMADTETEIREKIIKLLVEDNFLGIIEAKNAILGKMTNDTIKEIEQRRLNARSMFKLADNRADSSFSLEDTFEVPLSDDDKYNLMYFSSFEFESILEHFQIPPESNAKRTQPLEISVLSLAESSRGRMLEGRGFESEDLAAQINSILSIDVTMLLHEMMSGFLSVSTTLLDNILSNIEETVNPTDSSQSTMSDPERDNHLLSILANLLFAYDGLGEKCNNFLDRLQIMAKSCNSKSSMLRDKLYKNMEDCYYFFNDFVDIPVFSGDQFNNQINIKTTSEAATNDIITSGKADKLQEIEKMRNELNDTMDDSCDVLRKLANIESKISAEAGIFYVTSNYVSEERLCESVDYFSGLLGNEHRNIRSTGVDAIVGISKANFSHNAGANVSKKNKLMTKVQGLLDGAIQILTLERHSLFRRKVDYVKLVASLVIFNGNEVIRNKTLSLLVELWKDPDSEVRLQSIRMVKMLGELKMTEVLDGFDEKTVGPVNLMKETSSLLNNRVYPDKDLLTELLQCGRIKFRAPAQKAAVTPPIGPLLGQCGLKAMDYVKRFNEETKKFIPGIPLNVAMEVKSDKTYTQIIKTPSTSWLLKRAVGIPKADPEMNGRTTFNGTVSMRQIYEIALVKATDPHVAHLELHAICCQVLAIARHLKLKIIE